MREKVLIVGGGISGITAAAYLSKIGKKVTLLEKAESLGGLIGSFERNGFVFDSGIRAIENSGVVFPMLNELGIEIPFEKNTVSIGIEDKIIKLSSTNGLSEYMKLLTNTFPEEESTIREIIDLITKISKYMDVLYGIDNPLFLDPKKDRKYLMKTVLPWMIKYMFTINKIQKLSIPVNSFLSKITNNKSLIDMITQHFFKDTPTFFALSYFRLYTDYYYPKGGTGTLVKKMKDYILNNNGQIKTNTEVINIDVSNNTVYCSNNSDYNYDQLLWAADLKSLYHSAHVGKTKDVNMDTYKNNKKQILSAKGNDSIFSLYLSTEFCPKYYLGKCSEHTFYTPQKAGLSSMQYSASELLSLLNGAAKDSKKQLLFSWIKEYAQKTTFEISIPALRDSSLAPAGKSGLIVSTVFDYELTSFINENCFYEEFKDVFSRTIIESLNSTIFPKIKENIISMFSSTPLTIQNRLNNSDGAITGWAFTMKPPVENRMKKIAKAVNTPFKDIYQSGHWVFSPSGFPTSIITAKLAVNKILRG